MSKRKQITENINAALKSGDTTRPIIGKDAYAPKAGKGDKTAKTLTALVKEAKDAALDAEIHAKIAKNNEKQAFDWRMEAAREVKRASAQTTTAKWCAAIAAASAIISIITAAI